MVKKLLIAIFFRSCFVFRFSFARCGQVQQKKSAGAHREECAPAVYYLTQSFFLSVFFAIFEK